MIEVPKRKKTKIDWFLEDLKRYKRRFAMLGFENLGEIKGLGSGENGIFCILI